MGYYTRYSLEVEGPNPESKYGHVIRRLRNDCEEAEYALDENGDPSGDESKWYDHNNDLVKFSKQYPNLVFHLYGEGEEAGDLWYKHFQNGESQTCKAIITFDECRFKPGSVPDDPIAAYEAEHGPIDDLPPHVAELVRKGLANG